MLHFTTNTSKQDRQMTALSTRYRGFISRPAVVKRYNRRLLAGSVLTFVMLAVWLGMFWATFLIIVAAVLAVWAAACRRWPLVRIFTMWAVLGFIQGLLDD
jgi:hypothetical protein